MRRILGCAAVLGALFAAAGTVSAAGPGAVCAPVPNPSGTGYWTPFGDGAWTANGLVTTSKAAPGQPYGVTCGGANVYGSSLPTSDPSQVTALSFDFAANQSGPSGNSPRLVVCFSDGPGCNSNGSLSPSSWTAGVWTHVDGFNPATGQNASWSNQGGRCGTTFNTTWSAIVACHPGASIVQVAIVNDSGALYTSGAAVLLNNLRFNNVFAHAAVPVFGQTATVVPTSGGVTVKRPGAHRFTQVKTVATLPYGTLVNAVGGHLQVIAAKRGKALESGEFYDGSFRLTQAHSGVVQAALMGRPRGCKRDGGAHESRSRTFKLWGHVHGRYRTRGRYGSASVRGTIWLTENRCDGTFFHVVKGTLFIRDFTRHRSIVLHAGHSYLARSQPPDTFDHDGDFFSDRAAGLIHEHGR
jgi:hypothetical protein